MTANTGRKGGAAMGRAPRQRNGAMNGRMRVTRWAGTTAGLCFLLLIVGCSQPTQPTWRVVTDFVGVSGTSGSDAYALGAIFIRGQRQSLLLHYDGRRWRALDTGATAYLADMWGSPTDQFVVGFIPTDAGVILHRTYADGRWTTATDLVDLELFGVWGSSASDVFAVGSGRYAGGGAILHYDGTGWTTQVDTLGMLDVWGSSASDVFAVGAGILHYDGAAWSTHVGNGFFIGVWGTSGSDVFAVGGSGTVLHYDGNAWSGQDTPATAILTDVWGSSGSDVFAVGYGGTILHYDGNAWSSQDSGTIQALQGVWGSSASDVFAAGYDGTLLHYDGSRWSAVIWDPLLGNWPVPM